MKHGTIYLLYELVCIYTFLSCKLYSVLNLSSISMFPKSTHQTFSTKLFQHFLSHTRFRNEKFSETDFTFSHYAGKVTQFCCTSCLAQYIHILYKHIFRKKKVNIKTKFRFSSLKIIPFATLVHSVNLFTTNVLGGPTL
jgi:hypothetical protein